MAVTATKQTLVDGPRNLVVKCHLVGDGTDATSAALINASDYADWPGDGAWLKIHKIEYSLGAFDVELEWDATANVDILTLGANTAGEAYFGDIGGLPNNAGSGVTGDIDFTTNGNSAGDDGTITIWMKKKTL